MKKNIFSVLALCMAMPVASGCGGGISEAGADGAADADDVVASTLQHEGDSTIYGLACDGCTDTILVFLSSIGGDPDTLNVLEATRRHRVFGRPSIGDKLAVMRNAADTTVADLVINMETLRGSWFYEVMPTLRPRPDLGDLTQAQLLRLMPDTLRDSLVVPREYGMQIRGEGRVSFAGKFYPHGQDDDSPVEYPQRRSYRQWFVYNGRLVLVETQRDSLGQERPTATDTAVLVALTPDTLVLRFTDRQQGYYRQSHLEATGTDERK